MKEYLYVKRRHSHACRSETAGPLPGAGATYPLFLPVASSPQPYPLLICIETDRWRASEAGASFPERSFFVQKGFAVAYIAPEEASPHSFPAQIEAVRTAIRYFRSQAALLRIDPKHIFLMGGSVGGYLAAMAALLADKPLFQGSLYPGVSDRVSGAICLCGIFDLPMYQSTCHAARDSVLPSAAAASEPVSLRQASASTHVTEKTVPFLLLHGTADLTIPWSQSSYFHDLLSQAGSPAALYLINYAKHASEEFRYRQIQKIELGFMEQILRKDREHTAGPAAKHTLY